MMSEEIDYTAMNWVRHELNEKLMQARQCLEKFAETPGNTEPLKECMSSLHQARGPLQMVELQGADRLASEMEGVVDALIQERIEPTEATLEILMQAFIQLPDYLSRLRSGRREVPVVLLPLINRLRAVCGQEPLPENVIFSPDLTIPVPAACFNSQLLDELPDVRELARTYRQRFQTGLVEWYRGGKNSSGLHKLHEVLASLQQGSRHEAAARLWWFSAGLSEALTRGALPPSTDIKQLFGRIERQLKRLIDVGEAAFSGTIPEDLLKLLLFHILQADTSAGRVGDIRENYAPRESDRCAATESLAGRNEELLNSVSVASCERLEQIKTRLDGFMRAGMGELTDLSAIADDMHGLGNTVGMIGMEHAGRILAEHERTARAMIEGNQPVDVSGLMHMADAMLAVEAALRDVHVGEAALVQAETTQDLAYRQGLDAVIREIATDMTDVRERIDNYIKMPDRRDVLAGVPVILDRVRGSLLLAEQERAAGLVTQICDYISQELIAAAQVPDDRQMDTLADAICGIEYYVEALKENPSPGGRLLDVAEQSLANLVYSSVSRGMQARAGQAGRVAVSFTVHPAVPDAPVITALQVIADDVDREILDVFIEEAEAEIALLAHLLPKCMTDAGNGEMLETIRRALHTLKGSGRMVGAMALGEFAWSFERLLKQFMDASAGSGEEQLKLLARVTGPLSQLLEQIKGGPAPEADVNDLVVQAVRLMHPGTPRARPLCWRGARGYGSNSG